jgi:antitoxin PrlF
MLAVVTSKGQLTLPKGIREHLGLKAGSRLDFHVNAQGWLMARPVNNTALGLAGLLRRPGQKAVPLEAMDEAVQATAAELNAPAAKARALNKAPPARKPPKPNRAAGKKA